MSERQQRGLTGGGRRSLSQPASGPLPSLSPRAKPAQLLSLTLRLFSRTARPGHTHRAPTHTRREDTEWRRKGARAACPPRTPRMTPGNGRKLCFFKLSFAPLITHTHTSETNLLSCERTSTHTHNSRVKSEVILPDHPPLKKKKKLHG